MSRERQALERHQLTALRELVDAIRPANQFYEPRLRDAGIDAALGSIVDFTARMRPTTKQELVEDQAAHPPYGTNLTYPPARYTRFCQTSGTTDRPLRWLDTPEGWQWMLENWKRVFDTARVGTDDRALFAFSFGPFLGFWTAFEAAVQLGLMCIPTGGMSTAARLQVILDNAVTVLCCTPTYALRLAEVASAEGIEMGRSRVRRIIVAGEPGGSVPALRAAIERAWTGARVFDHHGMTEIGPVSFQDPDRPGVLHVNEASYLAEIVDPRTLDPVERGATGELILTTLGRAGSPLLRYRTGDLVRQSLLAEEVLGRCDLALDGGILGRVDDMVLVRGVNLFPSAVEQVVRGFDEVAEYRVEVHEGRGLADVRLLVEPAPACAETDALCRRIGAALRDTFQLRIEVRAVEPASLPRFELKARRWVRAQPSPPASSL